MSQEKLQAFAEAVSKNQELQKRLVAIQMESARSTAEKIAELSESAGTPFTAEEYLQTVTESAKELSPEQLHSVAGGALGDVDWEMVVGSLMGLGVGCIYAGLVSYFDGKDCGLFAPDDPRRNRL